MKFISMKMHLPNKKHSENVQPEWFYQCSINDSRRLLSTLITSRIFPHLWIFAKSVLPLAHPSTELCRVAVLFIGAGLTEKSGSSAGTSQKTPKHRCKHDCVCGVSTVVWRETKSGSKWRLCFWSAARSQRWWDDTCRWLQPFQNWSKTLNCSMASSRGRLMIISLGCSQSCAQIARWHAGFGTSTIWARQKKRKKKSSLLAFRFGNFPPRHSENVTTADE